VQVSCRPVQCKSERVSGGVGYEEPRCGGLEGVSKERQVWNAVTAASRWLMGLDCWHTTCKSSVVGLASSEKEELRPRGHLKTPDLPGPTISYSFPSRDLISRV
jgi:hypothetical protein